MASSSNSQHSLLTAATTRVKNYLMKTSAKIIGDAEWETQFHSNPNTVDHRKLPTRVFAQMAEIIANNPFEAAMTPNHILNHLENAIYLRMSQASRYIPKSEKDVAAVEGYDKHLHFIMQMEAVDRILREGVKRHHRYVPRTTDDSNDNDDLPPITSALSREPQDENIDLQLARFEFLGVLTRHLNHFMDLKANAACLWGQYKQRNISVCKASGETNLMYQLIDKLIREFLFVEQEVEKWLFHFGCERLHNLYMVAEIMRLSALAQSDPVSGAAYYKIAKEVMIPVLRNYLRHWPMSNEESDRQYLRAPDSIIPFGRAFQTLDGVRMQPNDQDQSQDVMYVLMWKHSSTSVLMGEQYRLGKVDKNSNAPCFPICDRVTRSAPASLLRKKISNPEPIKLDLLIDILRELGQDLDRPMKELRAVGEATKRSVEKYIETFENTVPPDLQKAYTNAIELALQDPVANKLKTLGNKTPISCSFHTRSNPVLCGTIIHDILASMHKGVAEIEKLMPYMTCAMSLFNAVRKSGWPNLRWDDAFYVLKHQGYPAFFRRDNLPTTPTGFSSCLKSALQSLPNRQVPGSSAFMELVRKQGADGDSNSLDDIQRFLTPYMKPKSEWGTTSSPFATPDWALQAGIEKMKKELLEEAQSTGHASSSRTHAPSRPPTINHPTPTAIHNNPTPTPTLNAFSTLFENEDLHLYFNYLDFHATCFDVVNSVAAIYRNRYPEHPSWTGNTSWKCVPKLLAILAGESAEKRKQILDLVALAFDRVLRGRRGEGLERARGLSGLAVGGL